MSAQNFVSAPERSNSFSAPATGSAPGKGAELGGAIKGFGSGTPHASTVNAVGGDLAAAPKAPGKSVKGFSGTGVIAGKV